MVWCIYSRKKVILTVGDVYMKRKGFTLVELLGVIVVLAIIALITTPIILGIIESTRKGAFVDSVYGLIETTNYT